MFLSKIILHIVSGIVRISPRSNMTLNPTYELHIVAMDSFDPRKVSNSTILYVRVARKPTINLIDTTIGQFQIKTQIDMSDFDHLDNLVKYQVLVQQFDANKNNGKLLLFLGKMRESRENNNDGDGYNNKDDDDNNDNP